MPRRLPVFLVLAFFLVACSATKTTPTSRPLPAGTVIPATVEPGGGFGLSIRSPFQGENPVVFRVPSGKAFAADLGVLNDAPKQIPFALACIADLVQVPCVANQPKTYHFELGSKGEKSFPIRLDRLADGLHDVLLLVFFNPAQHSTDADYRQLSRFLFHPARFNVLVGNAATPFTRQPQEFTEPDAGAQTGQGLFELSRAPIGQKVTEIWRQETVQAGKLFTYHITFNNPAPMPLTMGYIAFLDFEQIPLSQAAPGAYVKVGSLARGSLVTQLVAPSTSGPHELVVFVIFSPFVELAPHIQRQVQPVLPLTIRSSERVLINVP